MELSLVLPSEQNVEAFFSEPMVNVLICVLIFAEGERTKIPISPTVVAEEGQPEHSHVWDEDAG